MLQRIRDKSSGWIAFLILGAVIITMAFFGIDSYFSPKIETYAAKIEGPAKYWIFGKQEREISQDEFRRRFEQARQQAREAGGEGFDSAAFESIDSKRNVLDGLVDDALLAMVAEREGITVPEQEVAEQLKALPQFQVNGAYSPDQYRLALAGQGTTHAQFMASVRADLARRTLPNQIATTAIAGNSELEAFLRLSQQTRTLRLIDLPTPSLPAEPPTEAELQAWYDANASRYRTEEQVAIEYVEIDGAALDVPATVDEATLRARYDELRARYVTEPQRVASHILIAVPVDADPAAVEAARERAAALAAQAREPGADFAALARENSDDLGSKAEGGDLGVVEAGLFDAAFEQALFALDAAGQVTDPVRTPDGWHVIQLRELVPGSERPFEDVRAEIEQEFLQNEAERRFSDLSGRLVERIYKDPTALAPSAEAVGLPVQRTALFGRGGLPQGLSAIEAVRAAAFSDAQKVERQVSDAIEIGPSHVVVIHVVDVVPEAAIPFDEVKDRVLSDFNADRLAKGSQAQAEALLERARQGETLDALATDVGRTVADMPDVGRRGPLPPALLSEVFRVAPPEAGKPSFGIAKVANDRHMLFEVTAVTPGDLADLDDATRGLLVDQFAQARGQAELLEYLRALRKVYTVKVSEERL
ncbi:MAG TPA: SurA N-terminal domain-containing protein [Arenimonas sp.]|uniref:SurA N-terminal domain-containing protein n=1 Tax=Arenimonas sp. TaxID=1872635 RepID=UPI002D8056AF|nr:SurA N-terminal domain-containing protein [Arenimonas sp.]HEU0154388.1 SurA N-terminal domain-containing protein [Arenimonas sp.]